MRPRPRPCAASVAASVSPILRVSPLSLPRPCGMHVAVLPSHLFCAEQRTKDGVQHSVVRRRLRSAAKCAGLRPKTQNQLPPQTFPKREERRTQATRLGRGTHLENDRPSMTAMHRAQGPRRIETQPALLMPSVPATTAPVPTIPPPGSGGMGAASKREQGEKGAPPRCHTSMRTSGTVLHMAQNGNPSVLTCD